MSEALVALHASVHERQRPEDVAALVRDVLRGTLDRKQDQILAQASRYSSLGYVSSMSTQYARMVGADRLVSLSARLFELDQVPTAAQCLDLAVVSAWLEKLKRALHAENLDFKKNRLGRKERRAAGFRSKRGYNRMFRCARRLEHRLERMRQTSKHFKALQMAKSSGAMFVTHEMLEQDLPTACFVAYMAARLGVRSVFTNGKQARAFDQVAAMLLKHARKSPTVCWEAIALVHPEADVLRHLTDEQRGRLFGLWTEELRELADYLRDLWQHDNIDLQEMIVRRGNNSSGWNAAAGAWNKARDQWFSLLYLLGLGKVLDAYCPGKVMRLMAADVAYWHRLSGGDVDPATRVWRELPFPWDVFQHKLECTREMVDFVCDQAGVASWVEPPPKKIPVKFQPTPELVHGVAVSSPFLATTLRKAGWFSGKETHPVDEPVRVDRDENGFALGAKTVSEVDPTV